MKYQGVLLGLCLLLSSCQIFEFDLTSDPLNSSNNPQIDSSDSHDSSSPVNVDTSNTGPMPDSTILDSSILIDSSSTLDHDPYEGMAREDFYRHYASATSVEDALYRTKHGFMSGDITPQSYLPVLADEQPQTQDQYIRCNDAHYTYDEKGSYLSYTINKYDGTKGATIYYGGAYTSLEEVAAYLLAFGEVPPNSDYDRGNYSLREVSINTWGEYGRYNNNYYSNDVSNYPYEPELPRHQSVRYTETDFGTNGGHTIGESLQSVYNDGEKISRGCARFVFSEFDSNGDRLISIDERQVFYTYNHYNDFQEYLNYEGGWGKRFGFETAGNPYCYDTSAYNDMENPADPTPYPEVVSQSFH